MQHFTSQEDAGNAIQRDEIIVGEYFTIEGQGTFKRTEDHFFAQVSEANAVRPKVYVNTMHAHAEVIGDEGDYLYVHYTTGELAGKEAYVSVKYTQDEEEQEPTNAQVETFAEFAEIFGYERAAKMTETLIGKDRARKVIDEYIKRDPNA